MRVTAEIRSGNLAAINQAAVRTLKARTQLETGKRMTRPSDDPAGAQQLLAHQATVAAMGSYERATSVVLLRQGMLERVSDNLLTQLTDVLNTTTGALGSLQDGEAGVRAAIAVGSLRDGIASDLNTSVQGEYLFSGSEATTPAFSKQGEQWVYGGDTAQVHVAVMAGRETPISEVGSQLAQGTATDNVLNTLESLITALDTGDMATARALLPEISAAISRVIDMQNRLGVEQAAVASAQERVTTERTMALSSQAALEEADLVAAALALNQSDTAYRAALQATGILNQTSLLDFLR
jgi:flagellar hook-associated protein 3 FlgL